MQTAESEIELTLIKDTSKLINTCYFEFFPGKYDRKCWNQTSVFLSENTMLLFEKIFEKHIPGDDHYAFMELEEVSMAQIIDDLRILCSHLKEPDFALASLPMAGIRKGEYFKKILLPNWTENKAILADTCSELAEWLSVHKVGPVTLMGM